MRRACPKVEQLIHSSSYPMDHIGTAWDAVHAASFLASDEARRITGLELVIDGG